MHCTNCGNQLGATAEYCVECGHKVNRAFGKPPVAPPEGAQPPVVNQAAPIQPPKESVRETKPANRWARARDLPRNRLLIILAAPLALLVVWVGLGRGVASGDEDSPAAEAVAQTSPSECPSGQSALVDEDFNDRTSLPVGWSEAPGGGGSEGAYSVELEGEEGDQHVKMTGHAHLAHNGSFSDFTVYLRMKSLNAGGAHIIFAVEGGRYYYSTITGKLSRDTAGAASTSLGTGQPLARSGDWDALSFSIIEDRIVVRANGQTVVEGLRAGRATGHFEIESIGSSAASAIRIDEVLICVADAD
jgi:hypothetical protein